MQPRPTLVARSMLVNIERLQGGVSADVSQLDLKQASGSHYRSCFERMGKAIPDTGTNRVRPSSSAVRQRFTRRAAALQMSPSHCCPMIILSSRS